MSKTAIYKEYNTKYEFAPTNPGNRMQKQYARKNDVVGDGWHLEEVGEYDIQEAINSACPQNPSELINRYLRGDTAAIPTVSAGDFADVSEIGDLGSCYQKASMLKYITLVPEEKGAIEVEKPESEVNTNAES